jgi:hypothetical protein
MQAPVRVIAAGPFPPQRSGHQRHGYFPHFLVVEQSDWHMDVNYDSPGFSRGEANALSPRYWIVACVLLLWGLGYALLVAEALFIMNRLDRMFARHRLAANLLMVLMLMAGVWGAVKIKVQMNPDQTWNVPRSSCAGPAPRPRTWRSWSPIPWSTSCAASRAWSACNSWTRNGAAWVQLRFDRSVEINEAVDTIKQRIALVRDLPDGSRATQRQGGSLVRDRGGGVPDRSRRFCRAGPHRPRGGAAAACPGRRRGGAARPAAEEIAIEIDGLTLVEMNASIADIAQSIANLSRDTPAGTIGAGQDRRQIRSMDQQRSARGFESLPIASTKGDQLVQLGDVAQHRAARHRKPALLPDRWQAGGGAAPAPRRRYGYL